MLKPSLALSPRPWRREIAATARLAAPLALANLLQMLTYAVDVMFIARLGPQELAASALAVAIFGLVLWALTSLVGACAPIMAAELGARAPALRPVRRTLRMALWLSVLTGLLAMGLCFVAQPVMLATGQDPAIAALAGDYMVLLSFSLVPMLLASVLRQFLATLGRPGFATAITALGIAINGVANWLLVFGNWGLPALELAGAAIATVITALSILLLYVIVISASPKLAQYRVFSGWWRADWRRLREILHIGLPIALTVVAEAGIFGAAAFLMGRIGALELAAHTIALQIASLAFMVPMGISQATTIRVGYFLGAGDPDGVARAGWAGIVMGTGFMVLTASLMLLVPQWLLFIYLDPWDPANFALVTVATGFLVVAAAFQLFDGLQVVAAGALRGLKDTRVPMWIAIFAYWVPGFGLAAGLGLGTRLAGTGIWIGLAVGLVVASALLLARWHWRDRLSPSPDLPAGP